MTSFIRGFFCEVIYLEFKYLIQNDIKVSDLLIKHGYSQELIKKVQKSVFLNNENIKLFHILKNNDELLVILPKENANIEPKKGIINIVYEDEYILIVNKPKNQYSMPPNKKMCDSLANYVLYYFLKNDLYITIHLVNRLDFHTKGLVLIAKHQYIHSLFRNIDFEKKYYSIVKGIIKNNGIIDMPIAKGKKTKRMVSNDGKPSKTVYEVIENYKDTTLLRIILLTGRTHQIRVHLAFINHPVIGDLFYGEGTDLMLQSYYLGFTHPITKKRIHFEIDNGLKEK